MEPIGWSDILGAWQFAPDKLGISEKAVAEILHYQFEWPPTHAGITSFTVAETCCM